jgi:uncharacterized membrane protein
MNVLMRAGALGVMSGSRSLLAPALLARELSSPMAFILSLLALGELVADKLPVTPARTDPLGLSARLVSGAIVGASICKRRDRIACAMTAAAGALVGSYALVAARRLAASQRIPNALAGACEDALALAAGRWLILRA